MKGMVQRLRAWGLGLVEVGFWVCREVPDRLLAFEGIYACNDRARTPSNSKVTPKVLHGADDSARLTFNENCQHPRVGLFRVGT